MDDKLSIRKALRVFHRIMAEGEREEGGHKLNGLHASTDFDGYTASIHNDYVRLDIFFHNKYSFTFINRKEKQLFLEKLDSLDKPSN